MSNLKTLENIGWLTSDEDEILRRQLRAQSQSFTIENLEPSHPYFGTFRIASDKGIPYQVEIRSLSDRINSCTCPDYYVNGLGTCKHIEKILINHLEHKASGVDHRPSRIEIYVNKTSQIAVLWPSEPDPISYQLLAPYFSSSGNLLANGAALLKLLQGTEINPSTVRLSPHVDKLLQKLQNQTRKQQAKADYLADRKAGKHHLKLLNTELYPYQQEGVEHLAFNERAVLADEIGLGKTVQAIAACELLRQLKTIQRVLVIAPSTLIADWKEQIAKFTNLTTLAIRGNKKNRAKLYQKTSFFYLTTYEQVLSDFALIQNTLSPEIIILDEAQRIKNWRSKTACAVKQLKSTYAFVLTGTPLTSCIDEIYSVIQVVDPEIFGPLFRFNREYYQLNQRGKPVHTKNLEKLQQRLHPVMLRRLKQDIATQLPETTTNNYFVQMTADQKGRYDLQIEQINKWLTIAKQRPLTKKEHKNVEQCVQTMRMLCDTPYLLDSSSKDCPKINELKNILNDIFFGNKHKAIVFSEWPRMLELVQELALDMSIGYTNNLSHFEQDPEIRLLLSTEPNSDFPQLPFFTVLINLDAPWNPTKPDAPIRGEPPEKPLTQIINLICEDTLEHRMRSLIHQPQTKISGVLLDQLTALMDPYTSLKNEILFRFGERLQLLLQLDFHGMPTLLIVINQTGREDEATIGKSIEQHFRTGEHRPQLELIDSNVFGHLRKMINTGFLTLGATPRRLLYRR